MDATTRKLIVAVSTIAVVMIAFLFVDVGFRTFGPVLGATALGIGLMIRHFGFDVATRKVSQLIEGQIDQHFGPVEEIGDPEFDPDAVIAKYVDRKRSGDR